MNKDRRLEVKVGLFVVATVLLALVGVFLLGKSRHVFEPRVTLHAVFSDVGGLVQGAPVRVSGVNVGTVSRIMFVRAEPRPLIEVDLQISHSALGLVRADSVARISAQGLLGDKLVDISAGSFAAKPIANGGDVQTAESPDFDKMLRQASDVLDDAKRVADRAAAAVDQFANKKTIASMQKSLGHINALLEAAERGQGLVHALFYDPRTAGELVRIENNVSRLTEHLDRSMAKVDTVGGATDADGKNLLNNVSRAAKSVAATSDQIRRSQLVPELAQASTQLAHASTNMAQMTTYMKEGHGTLGALIMDPTIYEQLVQVLGGVGRSRILRALVRYAIHKDEDRGTPRVVDENNAPKVKAPKQQPPPGAPPAKPR